MPVANAHTARQPTPSANNTLMPHDAALTNRTADAVDPPRSLAIIHAAATNPTMYPPDGPINPCEPGENTGNPAAPQARYSVIAVALAAGVSKSPASRTASDCSVTGTSVPGTGIFT